MPVTTRAASTPNPTSSLRQNRALKTIFARFPTAANNEQALLALDSEAVDFLAASERPQPCALRVRPPEGVQENLGRPGVFL